MKIRKDFANQVDKDYPSNTQVFKKSGLSSLNPTEDCIENNLNLENTQDSILESKN